MSEQNKYTELEERAIELSREGKKDQLDDLIIELIDSPPQSVGFYVLFMKGLRKHGELETAHTLLLLLLEEVLKRENWELLLGTTRALADTWPESKEMRRYAGKGLRGVYAGHPNLDQMLAACKGLPLNAVFKRFDAMLLFSPGQVYTHAYWGEGIVKSLDLPAQKITLDFPEQAGKTLDLDFFCKHLKHVHADSFLALRASNPDSLAQMADEDPVGLVKLALKSAGGRMKQSALKEDLIAGVLDESEWTSWWNRTRNGLRTDPMIDYNLKAGAHSEIILRDKPRSIEEELEELFFLPEATLMERMGALDLVKAAARTNTLGPALVDRMLAALAGQIQSCGSPVDRAELALMAQDIDALRPVSDPAVSERAVSLVSELPLDSLLEFANPDYSVRALQVLAGKSGMDAAEKLSDIFPKAKSRLAQSIWSILNTPEHHTLAARGLRLLLDEPFESPEVYGWAIRNLLEGRWAALEDYIPLTGLVTELIANAGDWQFIVHKNSDEPETVGTAKMLLSRARSSLQMKNFAPICSAAEQMPIEQVQRLRHAIQTCDAFNESFKTTADHQLVLTRRELQVANSESTSMGSPDSELHWCTAKSREVKLRELRELNTVTIPANALEIERARQEGDLKENAGYTYAKEKQKLLMQQSLRLQQDVSMARIFNSTRVKTECISFGTRFQARNLSTQEVETFTMLGRFETAPERHILSYQSPFGQQFQGKKPGDKLTVSHPGGGETQYEVLSIENALSSGEWEGEEHHSH